MNCHLFIVDELSLKYHLEYGFVGTGRNNNNFSIGLYKDLCRLKINDKIIFYVQKTKKFYGIFKVSSLPFFDSSNELYLQPNPMNIINNSDDQINLRYRALISPDIVYEKGIDEFDLVDVLPQNTANVLWSILYRKLKGARGNSPIFPNEFTIIHEKLSLVQNNSILDGNSFSFENGIICLSEYQQYNGNVQDNINLINFLIENQYLEDHLHSILIKQLPEIIFSDNVEWLGNEVYSGAGMQSMDVLFIKNNVYNIIEVKKGEITKEITKQISKYILWLKNRFNQFNTELFQPILFGEFITRNRRTNSVMNKRRNEIIEFNNNNISLPIKYYEYEILENDVLIHSINYSYEDVEEFCIENTYSLTTNSYIEV